jgi:hypothetical protein
MVVEAQLGMNFPYNKELQERNRLLSQMDLITHNPQMLGGGKLRDYVLPGQSGAYPLDRARLVELQAMGGKISHFKKATKWTGFAVDTADKGLDLAAKAVKIGGINRFKKASRWSSFATNTVDKGLDLAAKAVKIGGRKPRVPKAVNKVMSGGRAARAEIVKKIMKDKGLGMIAASSYVKANNLY